MNREEHLKRSFTNVVKDEEYKQMTLFDLEENKHLKEEIEDNINENIILGLD